MLKRPVETKDRVVSWLRAYFDRVVPNGYAVVGVSGGKDSSVTAALCVEALGADRVMGVTMPDGVQPDIDDSNLLLEHLGIKHAEVNIGAITSTYSTTMAEHVELTREAKINFPPRIRMTVLYGMAASLAGGGLVVNTCNASEDYVGYSTKFGDAAGDLSPLQQFTVREVLQLGEALGLPDKLIHKTPSDGLSGMSDEDKLGFTYAALDDYIEGVAEPDAATKERIDSLHRRNLHKLQPMPAYQKTDED